MEDLSQRRIETQIRDVELIYKSLTTDYWQGYVHVFSSFQTLPRGRGVPDSARIIFKQESYDVAEQSHQRYPLRLLVNTPDLSCLVAQKTAYPDNQVTFLMSPNTNGTNCAILFYVYISEGDRRICCPYTAGLSLLLMNTEISRVLNQEQRSARDNILYDVIPLLPMHKARFQRSDQSHLHGFLIMKEVQYSPEQERRDVMYWKTRGLNSQVILTKNYREATCCRYSPACDDISIAEDRMTDLSVRHTSETDTRQSHNRHAKSMLEKKTARTDSEELSQSYTQSTIYRTYSFSQSSPDLYSIFVRDTTLIWSAFYRYVLGHEPHTAKQNTLSAYFASDTLLPYYPPQAGTSESESELQIPFDMRRSFKARTHNEIREGFPTCVFVNPDTMVLASNTQAPLYQATYFLEFQGANRVATPCYVLKSAQKVMPSYHEEAKNQLKITLSENLATHIDQQQTETAIAGLANTVLPNLLPKLDMENSLFQMHGTKEQFYLLKETLHKYYYWKVKPENNTVSMTINSTEASLFQISL
ncbi:hypothetical protein LOD99_13551 [Oopsacas minuta]|uniref:Uncharacterized protein n=1 Tax=Oopsacas minuta TaxID=111878 RepID=A0AAV7KI56_9METZ|nr:hypothetical protein LOD99_13551 [Oopsacas minuta]